MTSSLSDDSFPPPPYKIVVLGDSSVGKTSLVHRFTTNKFEEQTLNTIGAAYTTKIFASRHNPSRKFNLELWDTAGQERYRSLTPMYYRNAKCALICFDLKNLEVSFETAKYWIQQLQLNNSSTDDKIQIMLVATKSDLGGDADVNEYLFIKEYLVDKNIDGKITKTSSKTNTGILELFESIVDGIDDSFISEYQTQLKIQNDRVGLGLGARTATRNCC